MGSLRYYSLWFLNRSQTQFWPILSTASASAWKSFKKIPRILHLENYCAPPPWRKATFNKNHAGKNYWVSPILFPPHSPYFPVFAPNDFHFFRSLQNSLNGKTFSHVDQVKRFLVLNSKPEEFYWGGGGNHQATW